MIADRQDDPVPRVGSTVGNGFAALSAGDSLVVTATASTADSLVFSCVYDTLSPPLSLTLVDPLGRTITPDSAAIDPDIDYRQRRGEAAFAVRNALAGDWLMKAVSAGGASYGYCSSMVTEYGQYTMRVEPVEVEVAPGAEAVITAAVGNAGDPRPGLRVECGDEPWGRHGAGLHA